MGRAFSKLTRSTQTAAGPRVPHELVDEVLDHLADDTATLRSCSLVAKSWIHPSRRCLFNSVFFTASDITKWKKTFPNPEDSPAGHVRDLSFCFIEPEVPIDFADRIPYFSNVQKLALIGRVATDPGFISVLGQLPPSTRSVDITFSKVINANVISVIRQLPNLDNLSLMSTEWGGPIPPGTGELIKSRLSGRLRLRRQFAHRDILNTLMEVPTGLRFTEVEIRDARMDCFTATLDLVKACQDTLTRLHFSTLVLGKYSADQSLDFSRCTRIREVDLGAIYTSGNLYWITRALSSLKPENSPLLSAVTLRLSVTLSLNAPGVVLGQEISYNLSRIGREMVRIREVPKFDTSMA
ncbi:hypothetical protein BDM02DRAFT_545651 [Thelephora ganbajun]|uniref:Uncharacterized protein n=1 Tax=Thelephora ganbajun TaxID=370292 RepID=A0ACB6ZQQ2_THEGA|nr:hypothetical protein BDM02DRAFT_545651 [Thelephora ganbajun]